MDIPLLADDIPYLSTEQMVEVDRAMIEDFGIDLVRMMENAGCNLAHLARERFLDGDPRGKTVVVLAGTGGNEQQSPFHRAGQPEEPPHV